MTASEPGKDDGVPGDGSSVTRAVHDWAHISPSTVLIETIADVTDRTPTEMEPLYDSVDPDALDALLKNDGTAHLAQALSISFTFEGFHVTLRSDGHLELIEMN